MNQTQSQMVLNRVKCLECGEILTSYHRHDYKTCSCTNVTMVDGGLEYQRYGGMDLLKVDHSPTVYLSNDHDQMRISFHWGTYGKNGDQPRRWITPAEMSNDHIENILHDLGHRIEPWIKNILVNEQKYRQENNILIED
jgi:hypothetical protein